MYNQQKSSIQKLLDENSQLILLMIDLLAKGKQNECQEHQRTLHRNLNYLIQFDPTLSHHTNNLPPPEAFIQTSSSFLLNNQSDSIYRNSPPSSNILNQPVQNINLYSSTSMNKLTMPQQRPSYPIQQNGYGQYSIPHSQQQPWQHQSRMSMQQQSSSYQPQT